MSTRKITKRITKSKFFLIALWQFVYCFLETQRMIRVTIKEDDEVELNLPVPNPTYVKKVEEKANFSDLYMKVDDSDTGLYSDSIRTIYRLYSDHTRTICRLCSDYVQTKHRL